MYGVKVLKLIDLNENDEKNWKFEDENIFQNISIKQNSDDLNRSQLGKKVCVKQSIAVSIAIVIVVDFDKEINKNQQLFGSIDDLVSIRLYLVFDV
jgi:hypothetical protein